MKQLILFLIPFFWLACDSSGKDMKNEVTEQTVAIAAVHEEMIPEEQELSVIPDLTEVIADEIYLNGILTLPPQNYASVTLVMGGIVHSTNLIPGAYVKKGDLLATLENIEFVTLQQTFLEATAQTEYLEEEYNRQKRLSEQEAASKKRFQESKAEYLSVKSRKEAAAAQLRILGVSPDELLRSGHISPYLSLRAPISGYITRMDLNVGKHFQTGDALCDIVDKKQLMLKLTAYEKDLPYLSTGGQVPFVVNGAGGKEFSATILSVGQEVDVASRSLEIYAKVEGTHELFRPGMYVTARANRK